MNYYSCLYHVLFVQYACSIRNLYLLLRVWCSWLAFETLKSDYEIIHTVNSLLYDLILTLQMYHECSFLHFLIDFFCYPVHSKRFHSRSEIEEESFWPISRLRTYLYAGNGRTLPEYHEGASSLSQTNYH